LKFWQSIAFAETEQLSELCLAAEELGFEGVCLAEHLVTPQKLRQPSAERGGLWWEPTQHWFENWVLAGWLAAQTTRLRFVTGVYVLPLRDPFTAAKAVSSAAFLSGDRIVFGFGVGWMQEEFDLTGQDYRTRGRRTDEMLEVMAKLWTGDMVEHHGRFYDFEPVQMSPAPNRPIPVICGGDSDAALRRAARLDGWFGADTYQPEVLMPILDTLGRYRAHSERAGQPFEILVGLGVPPTVDLLRRLADRGVTGFVNVPWFYQGTPASSFQWKRAAMERLVEEVMLPLRED
jgi:probable F420-dependent oxidoreductase